MSLATPEIYCDVFDRLERDNVRYAVTGGVAVVLYGHVRLTADLDIVIDPAPEEASRAMEALASEGFVPSLPLPLSMLSVMRMYDCSQREVDVFVRYCIPFDELWTSSQHLRVGDSSVARVMSLEHLLQAKQIYGRTRDLLDIKELLALEVCDSDPISGVSADAEEQD